MGVSQEIAALNVEMLRILLFSSTTDFLIKLLFFPSSPMTSDSDTSWKTHCQFFSRVIALFVM